MQRTIIKENKYITTNDNKTLNLRLEEDFVHFYRQLGIFFCMRISLRITDLGLANFAKSRITEKEKSVELLSPAGLTWSSSV